MKVILRTTTPHVDNPLGYGLKSFVPSLRLTSTKQIKQDGKDVFEFTFSSSAPDTSQLDQEKYDEIYAMLGKWQDDPSTRLENYEVEQYDRLVFKNGLK